MKGFSLNHPQSPAEFWSWGLAGPMQPSPPSLLCFLYKRCTGSLGREGVCLVGGWLGVPWGVWVTLFSLLVTQSRNLPQGAPNSLPFLCVFLSASHQVKPQTSHLGFAGRFPVITFCGEGGGC